MHFVKARIDNISLRWLHLSAEDDLQDNHTSALLSTADATVILFIDKSELAPLLFPAD